MEIAAAAAPAAAAVPPVASDTDRSNCGSRGHPQLCRRPCIHFAKGLYFLLFFEWYKESAPREVSWFILSRLTADISTVSPSLVIHQLSYCKASFLSSLQSIGIMTWVWKVAYSWVPGGFSKAPSGFGPFWLRPQENANWGMPVDIATSPMPKVHPWTSGSGPWCEIWTLDMCEVCTQFSNEQNPWWMLKHGVLLYICFHGDYQ